MYERLICKCIISIMCNIIYYFPNKWQVKIRQFRIESNFLKCLYIKDCPMRCICKWIKFWKNDPWWISHANGNTKISSVETSVAKEPVLVILQLQYKHSQRYKLWKLWLYVAYWAMSMWRRRRIWQSIINHY